jgi:hypothetical protein
MGKKRTGSNPLLLNDAGLKKMWEAAIRQAVEDLDGSVIKSNPKESKATKKRRALEAYHWLMTERSDAVFALLGVYSDEVRGAIRKRIKEGTLGAGLFVTA